MTMDPDYLPFSSKPQEAVVCSASRRGRRALSCVWTADRFPYHPKRKYTPCDAPKEKLFELRDYLGFSRNVIVQASCHGSDNAALVDALEAAGELARGVSVLSPDVTDDELKLLDDAGVKGVRFNFVKRLVDSTPKEVFIESSQPSKGLSAGTLLFILRVQISRTSGLFLSRSPATRLLLSIIWVAPTSVLGSTVMSLWRS